MNSAICSAQAYYCHMAPRRLLPRLHRWSLRFAALLTLVLQVGVGVSPLLDHDGRIPRSHVERHGNRHPRAHNERTCVVCAVRVLQTPTERTHPAAIARQAHQRIETVFADAPASRDPPASNTSRAPPTLS